MKILLVEDSDPGGQATEAFLSRAGHEVVRAGTGAEALIRRVLWRPDAVLLDLLLPDTKPLDFLVNLRAVSDSEGLPHVPVVLTTAVTALEATLVKLEAERLGLGPVPAIVMKPMDPALLLATLKEIEEGKL